MSSYAWVITIDHLYQPGDELPSRVGTQGPHDATDEQLARAASEGREWRVLDGDCIPYYSGKIWTDDEPGTETDFAPLDDFGRPDAGATEIQYREDGKWVTL
jgi:hypothetical protein